MLLDVIIPTYNRCDLLALTIKSLLSAPIPSGLTVTIIVVDNNSNDGTRATIEDYKPRLQGRLKYVFESKQGRSHALNAGIAACNGDLLGFIDDDEEIDQSWYECVYSAFEDSDIDFIGGPYVPKWEIEPPQWLPPDYPGVIGWIDGGRNIVPFDENYEGILMGGNAVIRRTVLEEVGHYKTSVGRRGNKPLAGEDEDMYQRLLNAGALGFYLPQLKIYHRVPPERLTKRYYRQWCFWRNVSRGVLDRDQTPKVTYFLGVPRYLIGQAARGFLCWISPKAWGSSNPSERFSAELAMWDLAGFFYGKHFYRAEASEMKIAA